jgi:hypothetical protein
MISFWFSSYNELKQILAFGLVPNQLKQIGILSRILVPNNPEEVDAASFSFLFVGLFLSIPLVVQTITLIVS